MEPLLRLRVDNAVFTLAELPFEVKLIFRQAIENYRKDPSSAEIQLQVVGAQLKSGLKGLQIDETTIPLQFKNNELTNECCSAVLVSLLTKYSSLLNKLMLISEDLLYGIPTNGFLDQKGNVIEGVEILSLNYNPALYN